MIVARFSLCGRGNSWLAELSYVHAWWTVFACRNAVLVCATQERSIGGTSF